jgi:glycyl-tRNA synthetase
MKHTMSTELNMETIVSLVKRRGFIFQSSEIYGGLNSCWDYGPLGVELKRNVKDAWWRAMVTMRDDIVGLDCSILMHPRVWEASGHLKSFTDPLVDCKRCKQRFRADHIAELPCPEKPSKHPGECGGELTEARNFNLMFKTFLGPIEDASSVAYLRPETAQGIFVNFKNVQTTSRMKPPFGIAQIGKSFRNEITPGNLTFRTREFEQMEMEFFVPPDHARGWFEHWVEQRRRWYLDLGIREENLRVRPHEKDELAHYAKENGACSDVEYLYPFIPGGKWGELEGIANRTDFDLKAHSEASGKDLSFFDDEAKTRYFPYVIEPAAGADRATLAFLLDAYDEEMVPTSKPGEEDKRVVMRFHAALAPVQVAILPLSKKDPLMQLSRKVYDEFRRRGVRCDYDIAGAIGKRYRRQDEVGTPLCITVDFDSLEDQKATVRYRDSMKQDRVALDQLESFVREVLDRGYAE